MPEYDAVLIPGGGVRAGAELPPWVAARFDRALAIPGEPYLMPLSAGTTHRPPPVDERGFPISEARAGARYLLARGADPKRILVESCSYDTIGNAYFARVVHVIPRALERALVINSAFHMARTERIFRWVFGLPGPGARCSVAFESVSGSGVDGPALKAREAKEAAALAALEPLIRTITTLEQLHRWLFAEHEAYSCSLQPGTRTPVDLDTY